jgi:hypothetical protein
MALLFAALADAPPPTGLDNLWLIVSKADNVPIVLMIALFAFFTGLALKEARKHDRLIKAGRKEDIIKVMRE